MENVASSNRSSATISRESPTNLHAPSSVTFYKKNEQVTFKSKFSKYKSEDLEKLKTDVVQFIESVARASTETSTDNVLKNARTLKVNLCMLIALEAIHEKINLPLKPQGSPQYPDFYHNTGKNYLSLIKNEWGEIEKEAASFYKDLDYLIANKNSVELEGTVVAKLKAQLEFFADHQDTAPIYFHYREAIGKPMTRTFQMLQSILERDIFKAADNIEKSQNIDQLINQSNDLKLLQIIKQALQIKNQLPLLFSPSTRNIRLNRIENKIRDLTKGGCILS